MLKRTEPFDAAFHAALSATLDEWSSPEDEEAFYVKGYLEHPERAEEVEGIRSASYAALAEEPWD